MKDLGKRRILHPNDKKANFYAPVWKNAWD